jgi:hypothetical protein
VNLALPTDLVDPSGLRWSGVDGMVRPIAKAAMISLTG